MDSISKTDEPQQICKIIEKLLTDFSDSNHASFFIFNQQEQLLHRISDDTKVLMVSPIGLLGKAFLTKSSSVCNHPVSNKNYEASIDNPCQLRLKSQIILPILKNEELIGMVRASRSIKHREPYSKKDIELLNSMQTFLSKVINMLLSGSNTNDLVDISKINRDIRAASNNMKSVDTESLMLFLSTTVHDIRTPANSLYGFLELIEEHIDDERIKEFIVNAKESASFINTLTDTILDRAKENHELSSSKPVIINSTKFFSQIANTFSADMHTKNIDFVIYIDPLVPKEISVDELKLKRILINIIGNAYKFTPNGRRINFKVKYNKVKNSLKISTSDHGIGIDQSRQKSIFMAFEQAEKNTKSDFGGSGLGLSISAKYIKELGGKLKLKSELDKGSKFYFTIPIEVINPTPSQKRFIDFDKNIDIITNHKDSADTGNIINYLVALGIHRDRIRITDSINNDTTHAYCFQHKLSADLLREIDSRSIKLLILEESLFSLNKDATLSKYAIASKNTYYGKLVHSTAFSRKKKKILIVDDNQINIILLTSMLETEYVEIVSTRDGSDALIRLKEASDNDSAFDVLFIDEHMSPIPGSEVVAQYKEYEKIKNNSSIFVVSITGDPNIRDTKHLIYDLFVKKPFNTESVRSAILNKA